MKKGILFSLVLLSALPAMCQVDVGVNLDFLENHFTSLDGILTLVITFILPFFIEIVKKLNIELKKWQNIVLSWVITFLVVIVGWLFNFGILSDMSWYMMIFVSVLLSSVVNGIYSWGIVNYIFNKVQELIKTSF